MMTGTKNDSCRSCTVPRCGTSSPGAVTVATRSHGAAAAGPASASTAPRLSRRSHHAAEISPIMSELVFRFDHLQARLELTGHMGQAEVYFAQI